MGELYSKLCGRKTTISQQKNTSFGANEFRDGVSYNERVEQSPLVPYEDFAKLNTGECYVILPEISARIAKIQTPEATIKDKNDWFAELTEDTPKNDYSKKQEVNNVQNPVEGTTPKNSKPKKEANNKSSKKKQSSSETQDNTSSDKSMNSLKDKREKKPGKSNKNKSKSKTKIKDERQKRKDDQDLEIDFT